MPPETNRPRPGVSREAPGRLRPLLSARPSLDCHGKKYVCLPAIVMVGAFVAYPFSRSLRLSLTDTVVGREGDMRGVQQIR